MLIGRCGGGTTDDLIIDGEGTWLGVAGRWRYIERRRRRWSQRIREEQWQEEKQVIMDDFMAYSDKIF